MIWSLSKNERGNYNGIHQSPCCIHPKDRNQGFGKRLYFHNSSNISHSNQDLEGKYLIHPGQDM